MTTPPEPSAAAKFSDFLELTKPRLSMLSVITTLVGYLATRPNQGFWHLVYLMIGTSLAAGGVAALNQWLEHETDAKMARTANRPIPAGKVPTGSAFVMGMLMCITSLFFTFAIVSKLAALFILLTIISYVGWYTPAKRWSKFSTEIGAIAGAFPPLIGWAAGEGRITALGWILFALLFFWQMPHFMAISWTYRRDYTAVDFPMLPVRDEAGGKVAAWSLICTVLLVLVSLLPETMGYTGPLYLAAAVGCGGWFLWRAIVFTKAETRDFAARRLFFTSIIYLPLVLGALVADRLINAP